MKMAKASERDMDMAMNLCTALEKMERQSFPEGSEGENDPEDFDRDNDEHCGQALRHVLRILQGGSIGRVVWGMAVILDPQNKIVDPNCSVLEIHPDIRREQEDGVRYRWLKGLPRGHVAVACLDDGTPLDEAIDAAMKTDEVKKS